MWVFSYGSLMGDGWEKNFECQSRSVADLHHYERSFSKASVRNWGSKANPGPTLRVVFREGAMCRGVAFEFGDKNKEAVVEYLKQREGRSFSQIVVPIELTDGQMFEAITFLYDGTNIIDSNDLDEILRLAKNAQGTDGTGIDYIKNVGAVLEKEGITDENVGALLAKIQEIS